MMIYKNHFDRSKKFYPLIMQYFALVHGTRDLAVSGAFGMRTAGHILDGYLGPLDPTLDHLVEPTRKDFEKLLAPFQLRSEFTDSGIDVDMRTIASEFKDNFRYLLRYHNRAAGFLLIVSYESTKDAVHGKMWEDPLWQFFRQCRHACAHNGKFDFSKNKLKFPARWGKFEIDSTLDGTPLFKESVTSEGLISCGDPIRLLWDIEQKFFGQPE